MMRAASLAKEFNVEKVGHTNLRKEHPDE